MYKPTQKDMNLTPEEFIEKTKKKYGFKFQKKKLRVDYKPTKKEIEMLIEINNYFKYRYNTDCIYNIYKQKCTSNNIIMMKLILYFINQPSIIDDFYITCNRNCVLNKIKVDFEIKSQKKFNYPEFKIQNNDLFDLSEFYNRNIIFNDENNTILKLFSLFPTVCTVTDEIGLIHNPPDTSIGKYYNNIDVSIINEKKVYNEIEKCKNFAIVNVILDYNDKIFNVAYIIDKKNETIEIFDSNGVLYTRDKIYPVIEYGKFIAYDFNLKYLQVSDNCSNRTVINITKVFKKIYKSYGIKLPNVHLENNCFLAIIILLLGRITNPNLSRDNVNIKIHEWFKDNPKKAITLIKNLVEILSLF